MTLTSVLTTYGFLVPATMLFFPFRLKWFSVLAFIVTVMLLGLSLSIPIHWRWVLMMLVFLVFSSALGQRVTSQIDGEKHKKGSTFGLLVDNRFKMSLSRFQIMLWTTLVFSAITIIALDRAGSILLKKDLDPDKLSQALNITFPIELLAVLGISTASLAIATIIKNGKSTTQSGKTLILLADQKKAADKKLEEAQKAEKKVIELINSLAAKGTIPAGDPNYAAAQLEVDRIKKELQPDADGALATARTNVADAQKEVDQLQKAEQGAQGDVHANESIEQADWSDMFRGDLVSNYRVADIAKVQMFYITVLLIFIYATMLWGLLGNSAVLAGTTVEFPDFPQHMVELLGISHAGYLTLKQTGG